MTHGRVHVSQMRDRRASASIATPHLIHKQHSRLVEYAVLQRPERGLVHQSPPPPSVAPAAIGAITRHALAPTAFCSAGSAIASTCATGACGIARTRVLDRHHAAAALDVERLF